MSIFDRFRRSRLPAIPDVEAERYIMAQIERMTPVQWKDVDSFLNTIGAGNIEQLRQPIESYQKVATVFRCLRVIVRNVAVQLESINAKGEPASNKQIEAWLAEPFPGMDAVHWCGLIVGKMVLSGGCRLVQLDKTKPDYLPYSLDECTVDVTDRTLPPKVYKVNQIPYPREQVVSILDPDPRSFTDATSGVDASEQSWQVAYLASRHEERTLANGAYIPAMMILKNKMVDPDQYKAFVARVKEIMTEARNSGTLPVFDARFEFEIKELGFKMTDLCLPELIRLAKEDIGTAMGVPPALLGDSEARFANFKEQRISFLEDTVGPMQRQLLAGLNRGIAPKVGGGLFLRFKESDSYVVRQMWQEQATGIVSAVGRVITPNEARARLKLPPVPGGDTLSRPLMDVPFDMPEQPDVVPQGDDEGRMVKAVRGLLDMPPKREDAKTINGRTPEQRAFMWRATALHFDSLTDRYAKDTYRLLKGVKTELTESLKLHWETSHTMAYDRPALRKDWEAQRNLALKRSWVAGGKLGTAEVESVAGKHAAKMQTREFSLTEVVAMELKHRGELLTVLTEDATWRAKEDLIAWGVKEGSTLQQMMDALESEFMLSPARAELQARSEVVSTLNGGKYDGYKQSGVCSGSEWLTTKDGRQRDSHDMMDGVVSDLGVPFQVPIMDSKGNQIGVEPMMFPEDPDASLGNWLNGRCTGLPVVNMEDE